jgi:hypothetical protein
MRGILASIAVGALLFSIADAPAFAQRSGRMSRDRNASVVKDFSSAHFWLHTDLPAKEANELLKKLETEQKLIAAYWGRPFVGVLEGYVAKDFSVWPETIVSQMEPGGVAKICEGAGVTIAKVASSGNRFLAKSHLYAVARDNIGRQVPLHEAVHGYCQQTFGRTGPMWYAEGMAELGHYWLEGKKGVHAPEVIIRYLRKAKPRRLEELIVTKQELGGTWQDYAWWWFLCHLLENNPNYTAQFRALGLELLTGKDTGFRQAFGAKIKELTFEYDFFLAHLQNGYRVDLCAWDWNRKFFGTTAGRTVMAQVQAGRGWQPSGLIVAAGANYAYGATGTWRTARNAEPIDANGNPEGYGRLVGVVMNDYRLGEAFSLGKSGRFTAPADGRLYLRCANEWAKIAGASGRVAVRFSKGGPPLKAPAEK